MVVTSSQEFSTKQILLVHWLYQHKTLTVQPGSWESPPKTGRSSFPRLRLPPWAPPPPVLPPAVLPPLVLAPPALRLLLAGRTPPCPAPGIPPRTQASQRPGPEQGPESVNEGALKERYPRQCACVCLFVCECLCAYRCAYLCVIVWERERETCLPRGLTLCRTPVILNGFVPGHNLNGSISHLSVSSNVVQELVPKPKKRFQTAVCLSRQCLHVFVLYKNAIEQATF